MTRSPSRDYRQSRDPVHSRMQGRPFDEAHAGGSDAAGGASGTARRPREMREPAAAPPEGLPGGLPQPCFAANASMNRQSASTPSGSMAL